VWKVSISRTRRVSQNGKPGDDLIHRRNESGFGKDIMGHDMNPAFQIRRNGDAFGGQQHHVAKPAGQLVSKGSIEGDIVLGKDQRQRTATKVGALSVKKVGKAGIAHEWVRSGSGQIRRSRRAMQGVAEVQRSAGLADCLAWGRERLLSVVRRKRS
jgi:hypothetical protein